MPLLGNLVLGEDGVDRACLDAGIAVDALLGIDEELVDLRIVGLIRGWVDAIDRTHLDARIVLDPDARLGDHVSQSYRPLPTPSELDHAADAVLALHQLEAVVDLVERDPVRDERVDVDLAVEVELDELRAPGRGP